MSNLTSPLKWHGGKGYLAKRIIELMPPRVVNGNSPAADDTGWLHYVEPFFGGGQVLLANDPEGISEVANDLNFNLINFWKTMMNPEMFAEFQRKVNSMPFSDSLYESATATVEDDKELVLRRPVDAALAFFVSCRQSMAGRMECFAPLTRNRTRRGMNEQVSAWLNAVEGLPAVHERLKRVVVLNRPALEVIKQQDGPRTLFYLDAPYVHSSRSSVGEYKHEMSDSDHEELIDMLLTIKGRAVVSMYHHPIYDVLHSKHGWRLVEFEIPNNAASGASKRRMVECVWMNYEETS